jgi:hypothetical protein
VRLKACSTSGAHVFCRREKGGAIAMAMRTLASDYLQDLPERWLQFASTDEFQKK